MKILRILCINVILLFIFSISVGAAEGVIKDGRTLVPVRGAFENLGFTVSWDSQSGKASIKDSKHEVAIYKNAGFFYADSKEYHLDVPAQIINGSMYIPLRAIGDAVGAEISCLTDVKQAHISYGGRDVYIKCTPYSAPKVQQTQASRATQSQPAKQTYTQSKNTDSTGSTKNTYVLNTNTGKFHYEWCNSVKDIYDSNKAVVYASRNEVISAGYEPCKRCDP